MTYKHGKVIIEVADKFGLDCSDVAFAVLSASGMFNPADAARYAYHPVPDTPLVCGRMADEVMGKKGMSECIASIRSGRRAKDVLTDNTEYGKTRTKDDIISEMNDMIDRTKDVDTKAKLMKQLSDLQQMKNEKDVTDDKTVHYYMPAKCYQCNLYIRERNKLKKSRNGEEEV